MLEEARLEAVNTSSTVQEQMNGDFLSPQAHAHSGAGSSGRRGVLHWTLEGTTLKHFAGRDRTGSDSQRLGNQVELLAISIFSIFCSHPFHILVSLGVSRRTFQWRSQAAK